MVLVTNCSVVAGTVAEDQPRLLLYHHVLLHYLQPASVASTSVPARVGIKPVSATAVTVIGPPTAGTKRMNWIARLVSNVTGSSVLLRTIA